MLDNPLLCSLIDEQAKLCFYTCGINGMKRSRGAFELLIRDEQGNLLIRAARATYPGFSSGRDGEQAVVDFFHRHAGTQCFPHSVFHVIAADTGTRVTVAAGHSATINTISTGARLRPVTRTSPINPALRTGNA